jgi:hypothetical protein
MLRTLLALILLIGPAASAGAQTVASFAELPLRLDLGDTVTVRGSDDRTWRGRILGMRPGELVLRTDVEDVTFTSAEVRAVSACCDGVRNGTLIGLGVGLAMAGLSAGEVNSGGDAAFLVAFAGGISALVGLGIDAMTTRDVTIYRAPPATFGLAVDPAGRRLLLALRW